MKNKESTSNFEEVFKWIDREDLLMNEEQLPMVYDDVYNIKFMFFEKLHPFDSCKWGRIVDYLSREEPFKDLREKVVKPLEATHEILLQTGIHTEEYLQSLKWSYTVAQIVEILPIAVLPNPLVQRYLLRKLRYQTGGTVMASYLAYKRGWGLNIGGGFHHCSSGAGSGFCAYADITLAIKLLFEKFEEDGLKRVMIVDLDAHQGNGYARDFFGDKRVYIMDVYNSQIFPHDTYAKNAISRKCELRSGVQTEKYIDIVSQNLKEALDDFNPQFVVYNAGTDVLEGDPLGCLSVSGNGVVKRDEIVFTETRSRDIPIVMVTSGGYQRISARVIANSILNLHNNNLLVYGKWKGTTTAL